MAKVRITQVRSKIGQTVEHNETPVLAGMLRKVRHLVRVDNG